MSRSVRRPDAAMASVVPVLASTSPLHHAAVPTRRKRWRGAVLVRHNPKRSTSGSMSREPGSRACARRSRGRWGRRTSSTRREARVTVRGVLHVHSAPPALSPHVEWAVAGVVGVPVSMPWVDQPAAPGMLRAELDWQGQPGMAGEITSALAGWNRLRFEVTEEASPGCDARAVQLHARARGVLGRHDGQRRHPGAGEPAPGGDDGGGRPVRRRTARLTAAPTAGTRPARWRRSFPGCSASPGTASWNRSGAPPTARRSAGCTPPAEPGRPVQRPAWPSARRAGLRARAGTGDRIPPTGQCSSCRAAGSARPPRPGPAAGDSSRQAAAVRWASEPGGDMTIEISVPDEWTPGQAVAVRALLQQAIYGGHSADRGDQGGRQPRPVAGHLRPRRNAPA